MVIGNRLKELRESRELSQGDIEKRSGLLRCSWAGLVQNARGSSILQIYPLARP
jgi:transcriptional regulator with XRE-family HTH domain